MRKLGKDLRWKGRVLLYQHIWLCGIERDRQRNVLLFMFGAYGMRGYFPATFRTIIKARETAEDWAVKFAVPEAEASERKNRREMRKLTRQAVSRNIPDNIADNGFEDVTDDDIPF